MPWGNTRDGHLRKSKLLFLCFLLAIVVLIVNAFLSVRDSNDEWILSGSLQICFIAFVLSYSLIAGSSVNLKAVTVATAVFLVIVNLIPSIKYVFIYGYHDPIGHYGLIKDMISLESIPVTGVYRNYYGFAPGIHLFVYSLARLTTLDVSTSMKVFMVPFPLVLPIAVYSVSRKLGTPPDLARMMIVSTAITAPRTYVFMGPTTSYYLYVLFLYFFLLLISTREFTRSQLIISLLLGIAITISHSMTSFFLSVFLLIMLALLSTSVFGKAKTPSRGTLLAIMSIVIIFAYFVFVAKVNFATILLEIKSFITKLVHAEPPPALSYYGTFFQIGLLDKLKVLVVQLGSDALSLFLVILSPFAILGLRLKNDKLRRFYQVSTLPYFIAAVLFVATLIILPFSIRGLYYLAPLSPFFVGATLYFLLYRKHWRFKYILEVAIILSLICISMVEIYPYQPLIPKTSTEYGDYYVLDTRAVNTIYDRSLLSFVDSYETHLGIAADYLTWWQVYGLTRPSVYAQLTDLTPLSSQNETTPLLIIVHTDSEAHAFPSYKDAVAYKAYAEYALQWQNVLYTNGKSYVFLNLPFMLNSTAVP